MMLGRRARPVREAENLTAISGLCRQCGILNISQHYRPPRPVAGLSFFSLLYYYYYYYYYHSLKSILFFCAFPRTSYRHLCLKGKILAVGDSLLLAIYFMHNRLCPIGALNAYHFCSSSVIWQVILTKYRRVCRVLFDSAIGNCNIRILAHRLATLT
jgi:hypothetical protein